MRKKALLLRQRQDTDTGTTESGKIVEYNIFQAVLIVRYSSDEKLYYLYDIQNKKKETRYPSWTTRSDDQKPASSEKIIICRRTNCKTKVFKKAILCLTYFLLKNTPRLLSYLNNPSMGLIPKKLYSTIQNPLKMTRKIPYLDQLQIIVSPHTGLSNFS